MRTLRNAVEQGKVHHAYLFVGSRGTGKTSMAKILAACLNCVNGPTIEPCGVCESCVAIAERDVARRHRDGRRVEQLGRRHPRAARQGRRSPRSPAGYKVYILDEAHMLSPQAWNAFLKTLEEPPPHTIFVLATTEAHKVLPTVVDRCHRFDFAPPDRRAARTRRRSASGAGGRSRSRPTRVALLARHATGSLPRRARHARAARRPTRATSITIEDVLAVLGVADADLLFGAARRRRRARRAARRCASPRGSPTPAATSPQFLRDLEAHTRDLLVVQTLGEVPPELPVTPERDARLAEQARRVDPARLPCACSTCWPRACARPRTAPTPRTQLELALVKAATPEVDASTQALLARIERLEAALRGGAVAAPAAACPGVRAAPAAPAAPTAPPAPRPRSPPRSPPRRPRRLRRRGRAEAPPVSPAAGRRGLRARARVAAAAAVGRRRSPSPSPSRRWASWTSAMVPSCGPRSCRASRRPTAAGRRAVAGAPGLGRRPRRRRSRSRPTAAFQKRKAEDPPARQQLTTSFAR